MSRNSLKVTTLAALVAASFSANAALYNVYKSAPEGASTNLQTYGVAISQEATDCWSAASCDNSTSKLAVEVKRYREGFQYRDEAPFFLPFGWRYLDDGSRGLRMVKTVDGAGKLAREWNAYGHKFGAELVADLKRFALTQSHDDLTPHIKTYLLNVLTDAQPISFDSVPLWVMKNPNVGGLTTTLLSYTLKAIDKFRRGVIQNFAMGNDKEAMRQMGRFAVMMGGTPTAVSYVKDILDGKDVSHSSLTERYVNELASLFFFGRYSRNLVNVTGDPINTGIYSILQAPAASLIGGAAWAVGTGLVKDLGPRSYSELLREYRKGNDVYKTTGWGKTDAEVERWYEGMKLENTMKAVDRHFVQRVPIVGGFVPGNPIWRDEKFNQQQERKREREEEARQKLRWLGG